jgi:membrane protease YdiL (CAAX protease family)
MKEVEQIMERIKQLAADHPLVFGLAVTIIFILMLIVSAVLGNLWGGTDTYGQPGAIAGRLVSIVILLWLLYRLGWLRPAGFASLGRWQTWLASLLLLIYTVLGSAYAMTGNFSFSFQALTGLVTLFILTAALMEEVTFRGLILHGFVRVWGSTTRGLIKCVLLSSLFFCSIHILDFLGGRSLMDVILQSVEAFFLGILLASLVLSGKSIYPAIAFHGLLNLTAYLILTSSGVSESPAAWLLLGLLMLPAAAYGIYSLRGLPERTPVPLAA